MGNKQYLSIGFAEPILIDAYPHPKIVNKTF